MSLLYMQICEIDITIRFLMLISNIIINKKKK